jgi:regulator of nucleoside diphosphate kinase
MMNLKSSNGKAMFDRHDAKELEAELKRATLVNNEDLPLDVVRLNSRVTIKEEKANTIMELMVVTPEKADIKQRKISILSPIGTALIGYKKGRKISWQVPAGKKIFTILDVRSPMS